MRKQDFELLRDYILEHNPYLTTGYANAFKDNTTSGIYAPVVDGLKSIFPDDRVGNYFYLRNDPSIAFTAKQGFADAGIGRAIYDDKQTVYLVAVMPDVDEYSLIANLRNTCLRYNKMSVVPVSAMWQRENVVLQEMAGFDDEEKVKALELLTNETMVRIQLQVTKEFVPSMCIVNPCKNCEP